MNVLIEVPLGGEPVKYEFDKDAIALTFAAPSERSHRAGHGPIRKF
jgi:hypothetical protein